MTSPLVRSSDKIYRTGVEEFWWPLHLTDRHRVPLTIEEGQATLILVPGSSALPPLLSQTRHPLLVDSEVNEVGTLLAGPNAPPTEGAVLLTLGRNRPWFVVQQGVQIFIEMGRVVYCT